MKSMFVPRRPFGRRTLGMTLAIGLIVSGGVLASPQVPSAAAATQATFYVSPNGSDSNSGLSSGSAFATIDRARQEVRTINSNMTGDIVVNIAAGDYFVSNTIVFDQADKGTNGFKITYVASGGPGTANLIGGKKVTGSWTLVNRTSPAVPADADQPAAADGKVYKINVASLLGSNRDINSLFVGGERVTMARTPNKVPDPRFPAHNGPYATTQSGGLSSFVYRAGEIDATSLQGLRNAVTRNDLDAQFYVWERGAKDWATSTIPIGSINETTRTIAAKTVPGHDELNRPHWAIGGPASCCGARYFLQGNLGFLDSPGEYYLNKTSGDLYYYPQSASDLTQKQIVLPTVETVIELKGSSRTNQVSNLVFDGLEVGATNFPSYYSTGWNAFDDMSPLGRFCPESAGSAMPSYCEFTEQPQFKVGAITVRNATNIEITRAHINNAGMFGVGIFDGADHITVKNSLIENIGHSGVLIEGGYPLLNGDDQGNGYTNNNTVTNSVVRNVGRYVGYATGVSVKNSGYNTVSHLEIYGSPRSLLNLTMGWERKPDLAFPAGDGDFDRMKHVYAHHNTFEYLYLHDGQQDGGDDGAVFGAMLYRGPTNHRPNTFNQIVIDRIGAHPSMVDIAPNGMNLDMRAAGVTVSNFKAINPQHYNAQDETINANNDRIQFDNVNINFGVVTNRLAEFDDSQMEYDEIGVDTATFPAAYLALSNPGFHNLPAISGAWFSDAFDGAALDTTKWTFSGSEPRLTSEFAAEGPEGLHRALEIDSDSSPDGQKPVVTRPFSAAVNKVVTMRFFDRQNGSLAPYTSGMPISSTVTSIPRVDKGGANAVGIGVDTAVSASRYVTQLGSTVAATSVPRTYGWHELKWDYSSGTDVKVSIDGVQVLSTAATGFTQIQLGMPNGKGVTYFDRVVVEAGSGGGTAPALSKTTANLSPYATVTSSSEYAATGAPWVMNYSPWTVADGIVGRNGFGEWAIAGSGDTARWVQLTWTTPQLLTRVVLADRANTSDQVTRGRLVFSDGSTEPVVALPDAGGRLTVDFVPRWATSVKFEITASRGLPGLSEFETYGPPAITASSFYTNPVSGQQFTPDKAVDGIIGQWGPGEWATAGAGDTAPWIRLDWPVNRPLNQVVLYDRPNTFDRVTSGKLHFSDGTSIDVGALDNAGAPLFVKFPAKNVTWVKFEITGSQGLPGLSEIRTESAPDLARVATPTVSSQYNANLSANALNDGVIGVWGSGEWAAGTGVLPAWARLTWPTAQSLSTVVLYDRPNTIDQVTGGTLVFSDGTTVAVDALPNDGTPKTVTFPARNVTWVQFDITTATGLPGLSEIEVR